MKILYLPGYRYPNSLEEPLTSGDLRYSFTLSRALAELGHDVRVITRLENDDPEISELDGVHIFRYRSALSRFFGTSFDISVARYRLFRDLAAEAELIICNSPLSLERWVKIDAPLVYVASGLEDVKNYSLTLKESLGFVAIKLLRDPMKRATWKKSQLVNTTAWHEDKTLADWGIPAHKIGRISSSVDAGRYRPLESGAGSLRKKLQINDGECLILSVSRFTPAKGILETLRAFELLNRKNTRLVIVGVHHSHDDTYYSKISRHIASSPRRQDITLLENIPETELPAYYSAADLTSVFSQGYDPLPTTLIESVACGTPVVSTYYKTREQFIEHRKTGMFVEERNLDDWVEKVTELIDDQALRDRMSKDGRRFVLDNFDSMSIAEKYLRIVTT